MKFTGANLNRHRRLSGAAGPPLWGAKRPLSPGPQRRSSRPSWLPGAQQSAPPPRPGESCSIPGCRDPRLPTLWAGQAAAHLPTSLGAAPRHARCKGTATRGCRAYLGCSGAGGPKEPSCGLQGGGFLSPLTLHPPGSCNACGKFHHFWKDQPTRRGVARGAWRRCSRARTGCGAREADERLCFQRLKVLVPLRKDDLRGLARYPTDTQDGLTCCSDNSLNFRTWFVRREIISNWLQYAFCSISSSCP